jgi:diguanylate cyclase (GGDEF)-like protein
MAFALAACAAILAGDAVTSGSAIVTQLYPAAFLPLYGTRSRLAVAGVWLAATACVVVGTPGFATTGLAALDVPRVLSVLMVCGAAVVLEKLSGHEAELRRDALIDPLTGVLNRRSFLEFSSREAARTQRGGSDFAVLMADIDHFKRINDTHGHPAGDAVIREFAEIATRILRPSDILGRYGGEEFVISLPDTSQTQAMLVADRLLKSVEAAAVISDTGAIRFTVSIGVAGCSPHSPLKDAIKRADGALYAAKHNGRNRIELSPPPSSGPTEGIAAIAPERAARASIRILVVDDEADIRELIALWLTDSGYSVVTADSGAAALRVLETDRAVTLLFTDILLPGGMDGFDLGRQARAIHPALKTLYMSGYVRPDAARTAERASATLLAKPFRLSHVLEGVDIALSR